MVLNSLLCADVPLRNCSINQSILGRSCWLYADLVTAMSTFCILSVEIVLHITMSLSRANSRRASPLLLHLPYPYFSMVTFQSPFNISISFLGISWMNHLYYSRSHNVHLHHECKCEDADSNHQQHIQLLRDSERPTHC